MVESPAGELIRLMRPSSLDEHFELLKLEYHAQKREVPQDLAFWYQQQCRYLEERLAIAEHEGRAESDQKGVA
jgi:hypothetical protein